MESCSRIKNGNGRLAHEEDELRRILKEYFEDLYNIHTQEQIAVHIYGFDGIWRGNHFGGEPIRRTYGEIRDIGHVTQPPYQIYHPVTSTFYHFSSDFILTYPLSILGKAV